MRRVVEEKRRLREEQERQRREMATEREGKPQEEKAEVPDEEIVKGRAKWKSPETPLQLAQQTNSTSILEEGLEDYLHSDSLYCFSFFR